MNDKKIRMLLIEDDRVDQMAFERFVARQSLPYDYKIAASVAAGKEILASTEFDVIISDYVLGDGTSFELFSLFKDIPVVVTTGTGNEEVAVEAMKMGASDYLIKDPEGNYLKTLPTTVELALARKQTEKELRHYHENLESMVEERTAALKAEMLERKQAEKSRRELEVQLRQKHKMEAVGVMAGGIAHNFNNNLAIILGNLEIARTRLPSDSDVCEYLSNAKTASLRARDLVLQILAYSRQGGDNKVPTSLGAIVGETLRLLSSTIPKTVKLQIDIQPASSDINIMADASQIQEILINLCNNAVQAMEEKGFLKVLLETVDLQQCDIPTNDQRLPGKYLKLSVQDTGGGISHDVIEKIFDPFFTTKDVGQGTGMGLATVQGIVALHGGMIKVQSSEGHGSIFELYFPTFDFSQSEKYSIEQCNTDIPHGDERILFLDDDEMLISLGDRMLTELGYHVTTMSSSTAALDLVVASPDLFDLIITDQTMPDLSGSDFIKEVLNVRSDLPCILCTGYSSKISPDEASGLGIKAFLLKPYEQFELAQTIRNVLAAAHT